MTLPLKDTLKENKIDQNKIKEIFEEEKEKAIKAPQRIIKPSDPEKKEIMKRPTFELTEKDHQKLKAICIIQKKDIGKMLQEIVKEWLDNTQFSFE